MNNKTLLIYYMYIITIFVLTGYVVFFKDASPWWFLLAVLISNISPKSE